MGFLFLDMRFIFLTYIFFLIAVSNIYSQSLDTMYPEKKYYQYLKYQDTIDFKNEIAKLDKQLDKIKEGTSKYTTYQVWKLRFLHYTKQYADLEKQIKLVESLDKNLELELISDLYTYLHHTQVIKAIDFPRLKKIEKKLEQSSNPAVKKTEIAGLIYNWIGRSYIDFNQFETAETYLLKAIDIFKTNNFKAYLTTSYNALGIVYDGLEEFEKAIKYYRFAAVLSANAPKPKHNVIASAYYNIGLLYNDRLKIADSAIIYYKKAKIFDLKVDSLSNPYLTYDDIGLSSAYLQIKNIKQAKSFGYSALINAKQNPSQSDYNIILSYNNLAEIYKAEKQLDSAFNSYDKSVEIINSVKDKYNPRRWLANVVVKQAEILYQSHKINQALNLLNQYRKMIIDLNRGVFSIPYYNLLFKIYLDEKQYTKALDAWYKKDRFFKNKYKSAVFMNFKHQIQLLDWYAKQNETTEFLKHARDISDKLSHKKTSKHLRIQLEAKILNYKVQNNIFIDDFKLKNNLELLISFIKTNYTKTYFIENNQYFSEYIKPILNPYLLAIFKKQQSTENDTWAFSALRLIDTYKTASLSQQNDWPQNHFESKAIKKCHINLNAVQNQIFQLKNQTIQNPARLQKLYQQESQLLDQINQLNPKNNKDALGFIKDIKALKNLQQKLKPNISILSYFKYQKEVFAIHLTKNRIEFNHQQLKSSNYFEQYYLDVAQPQFHDSVKTLTLKEVLIDFQLNKKLVILPDNIIGGIPFESLVHINRPVLEQHEISYIGSLKTYFKFQQPQKPKLVNWFGLAPKYKTSNLQNTTQEIKSIANLTNGNYAVNENATKSIFKKYIPKASVIHLSAHGKVDDFNPMNSYIAFSDIKANDNKLRLEEASRYNMSLDLLVLSACESGIGRFNYGDGMMSMGKSFERAGVSATIMTLWKVPDRESNTIMQYFYKNLNENKTIAEALRLAKLKYLDTTQDTILKQPYYWAGFICYGNCNQKLNISSNKNYDFWLILGCIFVLSLLSFGIYRKFYKS